MSNSGPRGWHDYIWPGTTDLRNTLGVTDPTELRLLEFDAVENRSLEIRDGTYIIDRTFDAEHIKAIHAHLLGDLYDWLARPGSTAEE